MTATTAWPTAWQCLDCDESGTYDHTGGPDTGPAAKHTRETGHATDARWAGNPQGPVNRRVARGADGGRMVSKDTTKRVGPRAKALERPPRGLADR